MAGAVMSGAARVTETTKTRIVVFWEGDGRPILLTIYSPDGGAAVAHACAGTGQGSDRAGRAENQDKPVG